MRSPSPRTSAILAIVTGIAALALVSWAVAGGINSAVSGSDGAAGGYVALFVFGALLVIGTVVASVLGLTRPGHRVLWGTALALGVIPVIAVVVLAIVARA